MWEGEVFIPNSRMYSEQKESQLWVSFSLLQHDCDTVILLHINFHLFLLLSAHHLPYNLPQSTPVLLASVPRQRHLLPWDEQC